MRRFEQLIADWRKTMMAARGVRTETIEELENHLRETIEQNQRVGMTETEAFQKAAAQIGPPPKITSEFEKLSQATWWPVKAAIALEVLAAIAVVVGMIVRFSGTHVDLLLLSHVLSVTVGYVGTLLIGGVGICYVVQRCFADFSPTRLQSLSRFTLGFGSLGAGFTLIGIVLAMIWAKNRWGRWWDWDPKETGAFCVLMWSFLFIAAHWVRGIPARALLVLGILGNIVVSLGWFGANLASSVHNYDGGPYWMLTLAVALHFVLFLVGLAPAGWLRVRKVSD
jgi:hypothetical protein